MFFIKYFKWILMTILNVGLMAQLFAGAWVQKKGGYFFKLAGSYLLTTREFNHLGDKINLFQDLEVYSNAEFEDFSVTAYLEYGLTSHLTTIVNLPFKASTSRRRESSVYFGVRDVSRTTTGLADLQLQARYALAVQPIAISLQGGVKIPLGYDRQPENDGPTLGTAEVDGELSLLIGKSLYPLPIYITGGGGYRVRGGRFHDEVLFNAEVGYTIKNWLFKVTFDGVKSTTTPPDIFGRPIVLPLPGGGGVVPERLFGDQDIYKINPGIIFKFREGVALQGEVIHVLAGKDVISGTTLSLGLVFLR